MKLRLYNAKILPAPNERVTEGEVRIQDKKILYVGKQADSAFIADRNIDCGGNLLLSGFCNAHAHAAMCLFRGVADDLPLDKWLYERIFPMEDHLTEEDVYWGTMLQIAEYVKNGITCFADMYFYPDVVYEAAKKANFFSPKTLTNPAPAAIIFKQP